MKKPGLELMKFTPLGEDTDRACREAIASLSDKNMDSVAIVSVDAQDGTTRMVAHLGNRQLTLLGALSILQSRLTIESGDE